MRSCVDPLPVSPFICMLSSKLPEDQPGVDEQRDNPASKSSTAQAQVEEHSGEAALEAEGLPEVCKPTAAEVAKHNLTHLPYRRWCKWCVRARMMNRPHHSVAPFSRATPLFVMDYAFIKHASDDHFLTVLIGRTYPSRALFAVPCTQKGPDPYATRRLAAFFRSCGMISFTYMSDQEGAIRTMTRRSR